MKKFPAGVMVIPLLIGCIINTFFPDILTIGGFTTGLFKGGIQTLIGLFLFCSGATIDVKMAGRTVYVGVVLTALKFFLGFGLGMLLNVLFGEAGLLGLSSLAIIGAVTNSNGVIYATLAGEYGEESDVHSGAQRRPVLHHDRTGCCWHGHFPGQGHDCLHGSHDPRLHRW